MKFRLSQLLLYWALAALASPALAGSYALKSSVTLNGPWVTAGEVLDPAPDSAVAQVKIKRLGLPGKSVEVSKDLLLLKLHDARLGQAQPIEVSGAACVVLASSKAVPGSELQAFAEGYLKDRLNSLSGVADVNIKAVGEIRDLLVPDRPVKFQILPRPGQNWRGNVILRVLLLETGEDGDEAEVGQASLPFDIKVQQNLLCAARLIRRGELISSDNSKLSLVDASYLMEEAYAGMDGAAGLKARISIPEGKLILPSMLDRPAVLKRGDIVKLVVRAGQVTVATSAKVMRDAAIGDSIPVEVQDESKKQVQATVLDSSTVVSDAR